MKRPDAIRERPIIFSGEMVRAILEGRKTQTRRPIKPQPECRENKSLPGEHGSFWKGWNLYHCGIENIVKTMCPFGVPGDRLWVRETWSHIGEEPPVNEIYDHSIYKADEKKALGAYGCIKWRPSIHMPRWASRITLEITSVRVERVQDISEEDARDEGTAIWADAQPGDKYCCVNHAFEEMWDSIYSQDLDHYGWHVNPWVWVIEFRRVKP